MYCSSSDIGRPETPSSLSFLRICGIVFPQPHESSLLRQASWSVEQSPKSHCQCPIVRRFQAVSGRCMAVPDPRPSLIPLLMIDFLHGFRRLTVPLFVNQYNWFDFIRDSRSSHWERMQRRSWLSWNKHSSPNVRGSLVVSWFFTRPVFTKLSN